MRLLAIILFFIVSPFIAKTQSTQYNSLPGANFVVLLDFDGHVVSGSSWNIYYNNGNPMTCPPAGVLPANIKQIFEAVAEDFSPFNINVTTDEAVYNACPIHQKQRVVFTQNWVVPGSGGPGGVALLNTFASLTDNVCFVHYATSTALVRNLANAASHEAGHVFGLPHQSAYNSNCIITGEYIGAYGSGEINYCPIMGLSLYSNHTLWSNSTANTGCNGHISDIEMITKPSNGGVALKIDDVGNTVASAKQVNISSNNFADSGVVTSDTDIDIFKITITEKSKITINANPFSTGAFNTNSNLDIKLKLLNSNGNSIALHNPPLILNASLNNIILEAGDYFISIEGTSHDYQNGFGSIGRYSFVGIITPFINESLNANFIAGDSVICKNGIVKYTDQSTGNITSWVWSFPGGTPSSFVGKDPGLITYNTAGMYYFEPYSASLTVSDGSSSVTKTLNNFILVRNTPQMLTNAINGKLYSCSGSSVKLEATSPLYDIISYSWKNDLGDTVSKYAVYNTPYNSITTDKIFTVTGTDKYGCTVSSGITVKPATLPTLTKFPNDATIYGCRNDSITLKVSGANTYSWLPTTNINNSVGDSVKVAFSSLGDNYLFAYGTDTATKCTNNTFFYIKIRNCDTLVAIPKIDSAGLCAGQSAFFEDFSTGNPTEWLWSFPGGVPNTSSQKIPGFVQYNSPGSYNVTLRVINGTDTSTINYLNKIVVKNYPPISFIASPQTTLCAGDSLVLVTSPADYYGWFINPMQTLGSNQSFRTKPAQSNFYKIRATNLAYSNQNDISIVNSSYKLCNSIDSTFIVVNTCGSLPIDLLEFNANYKSGAVHINWIVSNYDDSKVFEIEKSMDGISFYTFETIFKSNDLIYKAIDNDLQNVKKIYYRLKIKNNNSIKYSEIKIILLTNLDEISTFPNPVTSEVKINWTANERSEVKIILKNCNGQVIESKNKLTDLGNNNISFNLGKLPKGVYFIEFLSRKNVFSKKIIKI